MLTPPSVAALPPSTKLIAHLAATQTAPYHLTITAPVIDNLDTSPTASTAPAHGSWRPKTLFGSLWAGGGAQPAPASSHPQSSNNLPPPTPNDTGDDDDTLKGRSADKTAEARPGSAGSPALASKAAARLSSFFTSPTDEALQAGPRRKVVGSPVVVDRAEALANRFSSWTPSTRETWSGLNDGEDEEEANDGEEENEATLAIEMDKLMVSFASVVVGLKVITHFQRLMHAG